MSDASDRTGSEIAVIGMAGRFPGADTLDAFWDNLRQGVESIRRFSREELAEAGESPVLVDSPDYVNARPFLADVDRFDAEFFGLSPQDAAITDPQHRIFLEVSWEALERAGYDGARVPGQVGVFATCGMNSYMMYHLVPNDRIMRTVGEWLVRHTGNDISFLATSVSYQLNLQGPSLNVQCACSSALAAIHLASQSLLSGECDMALAGGSVVVLPQDRGYVYQDGEILARDGHCRPFDAEATGTLFGSGAGVVVLRRLADALADGDTVLAVVKGSAVNNDGSMKVGFLAPSVEGQSRVVAEALAVSGVEAGSIAYVEAHGTGTVVGDPIEITALSEAFRRHTDQVGFCRIGSLKSNIGHLGEAAGVAGFIKTVLSLQHRELPPSLNYLTPNPRVDVAASPFRVNATLSPWEPRAGVPRRAGVTALGAGGTNVHVILEEAPAATPSATAREAHTLVLSARTTTALARMRENLAAELERTGAPALADVAHTLQAGRAMFAHRWSGAVTSAADAIAVLRGGGTTEPTASSSGAAPIVFLFPGGGAQYPTMGRGLYQTEPVFRAAVDRCLDTLETAHGVHLRPLMFPDAGGLSAATAALSRSTPSILSIFTIEYALSQLWLSWGITPAAISGHSLGEYTAACIAGVFTVEEALAIVKARGDIFEKLPAGGMMSVPLAESDVRSRLDPALTIAAVNAPESCVVSGPVAALDAFERRMQAEGVEAQRLHIDVAAHSPMLDPFLEEFRSTVSRVRLFAPTRPFVSNLTGTWMTERDATDPSYWVRHLRQTVRFADGLATVLARPGHVLLEVGPGRTLTSLARQQSVVPRGVVTSLRHPSEQIDDLRTMLSAAGRLWALGAAPDWSAMRGGEPRRRVPLPTYPFERQRHWIDAPKPSDAVATPDSPIAPAEKAADVAQWFYVPGWAATPITSAAVPLAGIVVVCADQGGLAAGAAARACAGSSVRRVIATSGDRFARTDADHFVVDPGSADDYVALIDALGSDAAQVSHLLYGFTLDAPAEDVEAELDRHFFGPLALVQALARVDLAQPMRVTWFTSGAVSVADERLGSPIAALVLGPGRVLPRELLNVSSRVIDVRRPSEPWERDHVCRHLAADVCATGGETVVAWRGGVRLVETLTPEHVPRQDVTVRRPGGVYLITGGLGDLALALAEDLARTVHANLVLASRRAFPPRDSWTRWLVEHGEVDAVSVQIRRLLACEAHGGRVLVVQADVADVPQLAAVRRQALDAFGTISGLFHTAGVLDDGLMQLETRESAMAVLRPKVLGTLAIDAVFGRDAMDIVVLFSSVSSLLGLEGQADYTAANAFLDQYAATSRGASPVVAINWGPWRGVGLAVASAMGRDVGRTSAYGWIDRVQTTASGETVCRVALSREAQWMIGEHVVRDADAVMPGTGYLEMARAALAEVEPGAACEIADVLFQAPVIVAPATSVPLEVRLAPSAGGYDVVFRVGDDTVATSRVRAHHVPAGDALDLAAIRARCHVRVDEPRGLLDQPFMAFGRRWANIERTSYGSGEALTELRLPAEFEADVAMFHLHPALVDMATGGAQPLIPGFDQATDFYVPFSYGLVRQYHPLPAAVVSHVRLASGTGHGMALFDVTIANTRGDVLVEIAGFAMTRVATQTALAHSRAGAAGSGARITADSPTARLADDLLRTGMEVHEGLEALARVVDGHLGPRVAVSPVDLHLWRRRVDQIAAAKAMPAPSDASASTRAVPASLPADLDDTERAVAEMWQEILGVDELRRSDNFFASGGHSLVAVRLVTRIERRFKAGLRVSALFDAPTFDALASLVKARVAERASATSAGTAAASRAVDAPEPVLGRVSRTAFRTSLAALDALDEDGES